MLLLTLIGLALSLQSDHAKSVRLGDLLPEIFCILFSEKLLVLLFSAHTHALLKDYCPLFVSFGDLGLKATWKLLSWSSSFQGFTSFCCFALHSVFLNTFISKTGKGLWAILGKAIFPRVSHGDHEIWLVQEMYLSLLSRKMTSAWSVEVNGRDCGRSARCAFCVYTLPGVQTQLCLSLTWRWNKYFLIFQNKLRKCLISQTVNRLN